LEMIDNLVLDRNLPTDGSPFISFEQYQEWSGDLVPITVVDPIELNPDSEGFTYLNLKKVLTDDGYAWMWMKYKDHSDPNDIFVSPQFELYYYLTQYDIYGNKIGNDFEFAKSVDNVEGILYPFVALDPGLIYLNRKFYLIFQASYDGIYPFTIGVDGLDSIWKDMLMAGDYGMVAIGRDGSLVNVVKFDDSYFNDNFNLPVIQVFSYANTDNKYRVGEIISDGEKFVVNARRNNPIRGWEENYLFFLDEYLMNPERIIPVTLNEFNAITLYAANTKTIAFTSSDAGGYYPDRKLNFMDYSGRHLCTVEDPSWLQEIYGNSAIIVRDKFNNYMVIGRAYDLNLDIRTMVNLYNGVSGELIKSWHWGDVVSERPQRNIYQAYYLDHNCIQSSTNLFEWGYAINSEPSSSFEYYLEEVQMYGT